jgi:hypothetical protein
MNSAGIARKALAATLFFAAAHGMAHADVVIGPAAVAASVSGFPGSPTALINQSGLSAAYVSGSTDFASYTATTTHANQSFSPANFWSSGYGNATAWVSFDLGASREVNALAVWNMVESSASTWDVGVYADTDNDGSNGFGTLLGNYILERYTELEPNGASVLPFASVSSRYFGLILASSYDNVPMVGISEVAFSQVSAPVPEPETYALMLAGLGVLGAVARRQRRPRVALPA